MARSPRRIRSLRDIVADRYPVMALPSETVRHACERMRDSRIGAMLVTDTAGRLLGIFTGRDAIARVLAEGLDAQTTELSEVMTPVPETIGPDASAIDALRVMWQGGFRHLPVVENEQIMGLVSYSDFRGHERDRLDEETLLRETLW